MPLYLIPLLMLAVGCYVGWNIGANDAANCIGTMVGAGYLPFRKAAFLMAVFVIVGAAVQGDRVMGTVGKGIINSSRQTYEEHNGVEPPADFTVHFPDDHLPAAAIISALVSAGVFVTVASLLGLPVSTSHGIVGGVAGAGVGLVGLQAAYFRISVLVKILTCWVLSPVLALVVAFILYKMLGRFLSGRKSYLWSRSMGWMLVLSSCYVAYALGANTVGTAIGPLLNEFPESARPLALMGGLAMAIGVLTFGRRVTNTVGKSLTPLDFSGALAAQIAAAGGVHLFSALGVPVSTSQAIVGAVIGVGLTKGAKAVRLSRVWGIAAGWVVAPLCAAMLSAGLLLLISHLFLNSAS